MGPLGVFMRNLCGYMVQSPLVLFALPLVPIVFVGALEISRMTPNVDVGLLMVVWVEGSILTCCYYKGEGRDGWGFC